jgi:hypothetical protein
LLLDAQQLCCERVDRFRKRAPAIADGNAGLNTLLRVLRIEWKTRPERESDDLFDFAGGEVLTSTNHPEHETKSLSPLPS